MNVPMPDPTPAAFVRMPATWYGYLLIATQIYLFNVQGNVIPFLQAEFALSYRVVSLHSSAIALGVIVMGLFGNRISEPLGRRVSLWLGAGALATGALLLCVSPAAWASISSCFIMGLGGGLIPSVVPAVMADLHGEQRGKAFAEQAILAYTFAIVGPLASADFRLPWARLAPRSPHRRRSRLQPDLPLPEHRHSRTAPGFIRHESPPAGDVLGVLFPAQFFLRAGILGAALGSRFPRTRHRAFTGSGGDRRGRIFRWRSRRPDCAPYPRSEA